MTKSPGSLLPGRMTFSVGTGQETLAESCTREAIKKSGLRRSRAKGKMGNPGVSDSARGLDPCEIRLGHWGTDWPYVAAMFSRRPRL